MELVQTLSGFDLLPVGFDRPLGHRMLDGMLRPTLDLGATDKAYTVSAEVPGVDEKDVKVEIAKDTLTIRGEKKQETEEKDKNDYRLPWIHAMEGMHGYKKIMLSFKTVPAISLADPESCYQGQNR
jgi:hypothetical protein